MHYATIAADMDAGVGARARLGLIVLRTDETVEHEGRVVLRGLGGVALYHSRIHNEVEITRDTLLAMQPLIPAAAALLPAAWGFKAIGFACTSASMLIGDGPIAAAVGEVHGRTPVTNPVAAVVAACAALGARRIGVVTPYSRSVNEAIAAGLEARGLTIPAFVSFEEPDDSKVAKLSVAAVERAVGEVADAPGVEAVFVSCTSIRAVEHIERLERRAGKPVTSSNHALYWHMLRLAGITEARAEFGALYTRPLVRSPVAAQ